MCHECRRRAQKSSDQSEHERKPKAPASYKRGRREKSFLVLRRTSRNTRGLRTVDSRFELVSKRKCREKMTGATPVKGPPSPRNFQRLALGFIDNGLFVVLKYVSFVQPVGG